VERVWLSLHRKLRNAYLAKKPVQTMVNRPQWRTLAPTPLCPQCRSKKLWRDGLRYSVFGDPIQRWLCRECGLRFSDPEDIQKSWSRFEKITRTQQETLKRIDNIVSSRQICVTETKNLEPEQRTVQTVPERREEINGTLVQFSWRMQKEGYNKETIRGNNSCLKALVIRGADLSDPESVKETLAKENKWSQSRRRNVINAYTLLLKFQNASWIKPKCKVDKKFPFIPTEQEIDTLIIGSGKKHAAFMQLLKETGMRSGEAKRLEWTDIDHEKRIITLNAPEKNLNPRMWRVTEKLIEMLYAQPKTTPMVFNGSMRALKTTLDRTRKRLAINLQNSRLLRIHFHTFRHWKATTLYHQTKDPYYVQHFLGHKSIKSTEIYINIEHTLFEAGADEQFTVRMTEKPEEIKEYLEAGFEPVCKQDNLIFLRKRK
jgi:transposase-like protein